MLLSFNKCSISALSAPIHQSVEETLYMRKCENLTSTSFSIAMCVIDHLSVCMYSMPRDSQ